MSFSAVLLVVKRVNLEFLLFLFGIHHELENSNKSVRC